MYDMHIGKMDGVKGIFWGLRLIGEIHGVDINPF